MENEEFPTRHATTIRLMISNDGKPNLNGDNLVVISDADDLRALREDSPGTFSVIS